MHLSSDTLNRKWTVKEIATFCLLVKFDCINTSIKQKLDAYVDVNNLLTGSTYILRDVRRIVKRWGDIVR